MDDPRMETPDPKWPLKLSPMSSGRRGISSDSNSPEFEFWMIRNPSFPQPNLLSADELFADGVLLPLDFLQHHHSDDPPDSNLQPPASGPSTPNAEPESEPISGPELVSEAANPSAGTSAASKRWKDIFKKSDGRMNNSSDDKEKAKRTERKGKGGNRGGIGVGSAELNINIWPFSRSRSAGNSGNRRRMVSGSATTRKVSSAPCSRSNSAGESKSKSRKWPSSPSRGGVYLGRSSPVWKIRRGGSGGRTSEPVFRNGEKGVKKEESEPRRGNSTVDGSGGAGGGSGGVGARAKVLSLNVPMCIKYRHHLSCRSDENSAIGAATCTGTAVGGRSDGGVSGDGARGSNLFNLRSLFSKKIY